jgi:glycopeptide antibiotics resistance protein
LATVFQKRVPSITLAVYLIVVAAITVLPTRISGVVGPHLDHVNIIPLRFTINCFRLSYWPHRGLLPFCFLQTFGNIALFLPFGILLPLTAPRLRSLKRVLLIALCVSLSIEATQFVLRIIGNPRAVDIDDVLLNTLGALLGFLIYRDVFVSRTRKGESDKA